MPTRPARSTRIPAWPARVAIHASARGPCCTDLLIAAGIARVVIATQDPDPRTDGEGIARLMPLYFGHNKGKHLAHSRHLSSFQRLGVTLQSFPPLPVNENL